MKNLTEFINEELDKAQMSKIHAMREKAKKTALLAIKKGFGGKDEADLKALAERTCETLGNYKDQDDFWDAVDRGDVSSFDELSKLASAANGNQEVDGDTLMDVIELIARGQTLDNAIAELAKKI